MQVYQAFDAIKRLSSHYTFKVEYLFLDPINWESFTIIFICRTSPIHQHGDAKSADDFSKICFNLKETLFELIYKVIEAKKHQTGRKFVHNVSEFISEILLCFCWE